MTSTYDIGGRRIQLTWPDGFYVKYDYDELGELLDARENGATSGVGVLASYTYDNLGRRTTVTRGDGVSTSYGFDANSDLKSLAYSGSSNNPSFSYNYDSLGEIISRTNSNAAFAWNGATSLNQAYGVNNLNQYTSVGGTAYGYSVNGNLGSGTAQTYTFDSQNRLTNASNSATLNYDPTDRLFQTSQTGSATTQFLYDGSNIVAEYGSGAVQRRYVDGPGTDEPIVWYTGSGTSSRAWLLQDERGSVLASADSSGNVSWTNTYDEYGQPGSSNTGRFQYTGQAWIPEAGAYDYKARVYLPSIGRFLQPDPSGYGAGMNLYGYASGNPVDGTDPSGTTTYYPGTSAYNAFMNANPQIQGPPPCDCTLLNITTGGGYANFNWEYNDTAGFAAIDGGILNPLYSSSVPLPSPCALGPSSNLANPCTRGAPPPSAAQPCHPPGPAFQCNAQGKLVLTPKYQAQACANYKALMTSINFVNSLTGGTKTPSGAAYSVSNFIPPSGFLGAVLRVLSPVIAVGGVANMSTDLQINHSSPPPGCK